jgi:hypothetical protein
LLWINIIGGARGNFKGNQNFRRINSSMKHDARITHDPPQLVKRRGRAVALLRDVYANLDLVLVIVGPIAPLCPTRTVFGPPLIFPLTGFRPRFSPNAAVFLGRDRHRCGA